MLNPRFYVSFCKSTLLTATDVELLSVKLGTYISVFICLRIVPFLRRQIRRRRNGFLHLLLKARVIGMAVHVESYVSGRMPHRFEDCQLLKDEASGWEHLVLTLRVYFERGN